ncbi:MAG: hypothetical protein EZS28_021532 [Streblomastix strix]|uniref:Uncharacterized protein n=1 Tax=Streblomastix strix TaxID=222440 RepID=A0A5J4VKS0_9EUKA|nr:MAG: hypothetical protein EZS28_021532 [Streblomastix strix]
MIRSLRPKFERLLYAFNDSHKKVTSITTYLNSSAIVSGGSENLVRLWKYCRDSQQVVATMMEHRMAVTALRVTHDELECVRSGSDDQMLTWFKCVIFSASYTSYPSEANDIDCKLPRDIKVQNKVLDDRHSFNQYVDSARPIDKSIAQCMLHKQHHFACKQRRKLR